MSDKQPERDSDKTKPEDTDFRQQRLRAWQPLLTPKWVIWTFLVVGIIFLPLGIGILVTSHNIVEMTQRYDDVACSVGVFPGCTKYVSVTFPEDVDGPIYFYYKLTNFFQNHRRYVQSRSDAQLAGESGTTSSCEPLEYYNDKLLYPCGLIANSHFSDDFSAQVTPNGEVIPTALAGKEWDDSSIAWESDISTKFKDLYDPVTDKPLPDNMSRDAPSGTLPDLSNQHLMVWMRPAGVSTFRKLNRKIDRSFKKGDKITVSITDSFDVSAFGGSKSVVFSNVSWIGGKNDFLAYAYIITGAVCIFLGILFAIKEMIAPRPLGEMKAIRNA